METVRCMTLDSVRARLVARARDWPWSNTRANMQGVDDKVLSIAPALGRAGVLGRFPDETIDEDFAYSALRRSETIGRPVGDTDWM